MINRNNKIFEIAAKKAVELSRKNFASARKMMEKTGVPDMVIERVLYEPYKIRSTD